MNLTGQKGALELKSKAGSVRLVLADFADGKKTETGREGKIDTEIWLGEAKDIGLYNGQKLRLFTAGEYEVGGWEIVATGEEGRMIWKLKSEGIEVAVLGGEYNKEQLGLVEQLGGVEVLICPLDKGNWGNFAGEAKTVVAKSGASQVVLWGGEKDLVAKIMDVFDEEKAEAVGQIKLESIEVEEGQKIWWLKATN